MVKEGDLKSDFQLRTVLLYGEREDKSYGPVQTGSKVSEEFLQELIDHKARLKAAGERQLLAGAISPVAHYSELYNIADADLAARVGLSARKVRLHKTPRGFTELTVAQAARYAEVFQVPLANLFQVIDPAMSPPLTFAKSDNPYCVLLSHGSVTSST